MEREKWLSNVESRGCDAIPCTLHVAAAVWHAHRQDLAEIVARYPDIAVNPPPSAEDRDAFAPRERRGENFTDAWGCVWENLVRYPYLLYGA